MPPSSGSGTSGLSSDYVELRARSAFSFLEGSSNPEDLAQRAAELGHSALALADRHGVYGAPRFHRAARQVGLRPIVGAEIRVGSSETGEHRLLLLVESALGWKRLCRLLSLGLGLRHPGQARGELRLDWCDLEEHARDLCVLLRGDDGLSPDLLARARAAFGAEPGRLWVDVSRHLERRAEAASRRAVAIAEAAGVPVVASGDVRCATPRGRALLDAFTCLRWKTHLDAAGRRLLPNAERCLHSREQMAERFADRPEWIRATRAVAERCEFDLEKLDYRFPEFPLPPGETQPQRLRACVQHGAGERYGRPLSARVQRQLEHELRVIEKLDLAGYFLIVHDITRFASTQGILCQGRGSAANSAVCYALGITAVDPVGMDLLFERFLSEERGEWPDIDLDLPSGPRRERVIQYVFDKYGAQGAAMTANVISYRSRLAVREMSKVVGLAPDAASRLARGFSRLDGEETPEALRERVRQAGLDPEAPRVQRLLELIEAVQGLPRHLGQHSGGVVIAAGRLDEVVPIEPARMPGRRVVQWDKDDCSALGLIKIDLLGLGMLAALEEILPLVREHEGVEVDLAHLPADDPETYAMLCQADTVGVFQVESRAQMATLPRLQPRSFYDLVVEIAIIRPGPIVGQMVHPYLERRAGRAPVEYPHPSLEPILARTLGVPIFQEQLLRVAMTAAGFSGGEAEELRRAMGFKRSQARMQQIEAKLRRGMRERGYSAQAEEEVVRHITSFALYGFPESHSASFALIAYASAWLKRHHPAAFLVGLLNAWPMGFYSPASLVKDAQRHGVEVRPIDVTRSRERCSLEPGERSPRPAVRIGLRSVAGFQRESAARLVHERERAAFASLADLVRRVPLRASELADLAELGALAGLPGAAPQRREALWQVAALERDPDSLFAGQAPQNEEIRVPPLPELTALEQTLADYRLAGLTTGPQLLAHLRPALRARGFVTAHELQGLPHGRAVRTAGHVIVRQRPGSARGFLFMTLEDETGLGNAIVTPRLFERFRAILHAAVLIEIAGPLQSVDGVVHVRLRHAAPLDLSRDVAQSSAPLPAGRDYR